jgi:PAS domain S-box-containing protein
MPPIDLYKELLDAAPDAIIAVDRSGRIVLANDQAEVLFGYDRRELVGELIEMLVPGPARQVHPSHRTSYFDRPISRPMGAGLQLAGRRKDGSEFPAEISLSSIETEEGLVVSAAIRDVTDRQRAEAKFHGLQAERDRLKAQAETERLEGRMHQSQRLESLGQLAGGVAHDFNNLLAVILNYTTFIGEELGIAAAEPGGERWDVVCQDVEQVQLAATRATELTHQLLAFGRREVVQPQVLRLDDVVRGVEQLLRRSIGEHVQLVIEGTMDASTVMADRGQLEQVLVNLAVNARDAMRSGGTLTIDTGDVQLNDDDASRLELSSGRYVRLRVSDSGEGMTQDVVDRVFEPFFTTKEKGEGSGLGLATVYGIITQAGGSARIYSEPGVGTTFTALLPASQSEPTVVEHVPTAAKLGRPQTILILEDEDAIREVTRRILVRNGHTVLTAVSGAEAIGIAQEYQGDIDLLLTDVVMPHMLGKEAAERSRTIRPGIHVLFMSGYAQPFLTSQGTVEPGVTLLEKPFTEASLLAKVNLLLQSEVTP